MTSLSKRQSEKIPTKLFPVDLDKFFSLQSSIGGLCSAKHPEGSLKWQGCLAGQNRYTNLLLNKGGYFGEV